MDKIYVIRTKYLTGWVYVRESHPCRVSNIKSADHYTLEEASRKLAALSRKYDREFEIFIDKEAQDEEV